MTPAGIWVPWLLGTGAVCALAGRSLLRFVYVCKLGALMAVHVFSVHLCLQGYTLADEEEDPLIYQHRMLRSSQGDALASGPVETGPMKKLHVSTINLQKAGPLFPGGVGSRAVFLSH